MESLKGLSVVGRCPTLSSRCWRRVGHQPTPPSLLLHRPPKAQHIRCYRWPQRPWASIAKRQ